LADSSFDFGQFSSFDRKSTDAKAALRLANATKENAMCKILTSTAISAVLICLTHGTASAQLPAPVGHRQPTAETVPADDSVRGSTLSTEHRSVAAPTINLKAVNPLDDGMNFPNICSNCDQ
jgi:hypothetical protein